MNSTSLNCDWKNKMLRRFLGPNYLATTGWLANPLCVNQLRATDLLISFSFPLSKLENSSLSSAKLPLTGTRQNIRVPRTWLDNRAYSAQSFIRREPSAKQKDSANRPSVEPHGTAVREFHWFIYCWGPHIIELVSYNDEPPQMSFRYSLASKLDAPALVQRRAFIHT